MKTLILMIAGLFMSVWVNAQSMSRNEIIDEMLESSEEVVTLVEEMFASYGFKCKAHVYYNSSTRELVISYQLFDATLYQNFDLDVMKKGGIQGMVSEVLKQDNSGNGLEWFVNQFKNTKTYLRFELVYVDNNGKKYVRGDRITPEEIQKLAALLY